MMRCGSRAPPTPIFGWLNPAPMDLSPKSSRIPGDTREFVSRVYGVQRAGAVTYQTVQTELNGNPLRVFLIGYELDRPGGPRRLIAGRNIIRSHYEIVVDRSAGLALGQEIPLGTHGHKFTVVGLMRNEVTSAGDPVAYVTLLDAQALQFDLAPPAARREVARGGPLQTTNQINAVIAKVSPYVPIRGYRSGAVTLEALKDTYTAAAGKFIDRSGH